MSVIMRPREDGPFYVSKAKRDGTGYLLVPYYAEADGAREVTADELADFEATTRLCGGLVVGGDRP